MKTPADKTITLTFMSIPLRWAEMCWTARLTFPPGAGPDTMLPIEVVDGNDVPVESGTLELAGRRIAVRDGRAELLYADFVKGKHSVSLCLHRGGKPPVQGRLTFA